MTDISSIYIHTVGIIPTELIIVIHTNHTYV